MVEKAVLTCQGFEEDLRKDLQFHPANSGDLPVTLGHQFFPVHVETSGLQAFKLSSWIVTDRYHLLFEHTPTRRELIVLDVLRS